MNIELLRKSIADAVTIRANEIIPNHLGDRWLSQHFQVLFPSVDGVSFEEPCNYEDSEWSGLANIKGICLVRTVTDGEIAPDPSPLIASCLLHGNSIKVIPNPSQYQQGEITYKLIIKFTSLRDFVGDPMVTGLQAELDINKNFCLMRKKVAEVYAPIDPPEIIPIHNS